MVRAGEFKRIYDPSLGEDEAWYINDHCFVHHEDQWHMFGITHQEPAAPLDERFLAHAVSPHLSEGPWERQAHVLHAQSLRWGETHVWAPHIVRHGGWFHMFYCGGGIDHSAYRIHLAVSQDLYHWKRHEANPMVVDGFDARDPMVLRVGDEWVMYYTGTSDPTGGNHVVYAVTSSDLVSWSERREVFRSGDVGTYGGPTESPFVLVRRDTYYLFVCTNRPYDTTEVYGSGSPFAFGEADKVGELPAHAAEVIEDTDGRHWVSRCGWGRGGLYLARLYWE